jgi:flagellar hook-associated protein 2
MSGSSWIGSLDVHAWAMTQMNRELNINNDRSKEQLKLLSAEGDELKPRLDLYAQLKTLFTNFQSKLSALSDAFNKNTYQITSSNTSVATAQVTSDATAGSHSLSIQKLAHAQSIASGNFSVVSSTTALNVAETLNIGVGSNSFNMVISATDSIDTIAKNINIGAQAHNVGVKASVMSTSTGNYRLVIASTATGTENSAVITETNVTGSALNIGSPGVTSEAALGQVLTEGRNSKFTLDSMEFEQASNSNINVQGMIITLMGDEETLGVGNAKTNLVVNSTTSTSTMSSAIEAVISAYNEIDKAIEQFQIKSRGNDGAMAATLQEFQTILNAQVGSGSIKNLLDLGIQKLKSEPMAALNANDESISFILMGQLHIADSSKLTAALTNNLDAVKNFFTSSTDGIITKFNQRFTALEHSIFQNLDDYNKGNTAAATEVSKRIDEEADRMEKIKKDLVLKYANLEMSLSKLQITSQYLSANISSQSK